MPPGVIGIECTACDGPSVFGVVQPPVNGLGKAKRVRGWFAAGSLFLFARADDRYQKKTKY